MASIDLYVDGKIDFGTRKTEEGECLGVWLTSYLPMNLYDAPEHRRIYMKDSVMFHGTTAQMRAFAQGILAKLPAEIPEVQATPPEAWAETTLRDSKAYFEEAEV
jgi:hypothetical protein